MHWEYKFLRIKPKTVGFFVPRTEYSEFELSLAELGRVGWELVQCNIPTNRGMAKREGIAILKRPK